MKHATIRTRLAHADVVADAVRPDNTPEMETSVETSPDGERTVVTAIERDTTGGLHATVDDYVVNVTVASTVADRGIDFTTTEHDTDNNE